MNESIFNTIVSEYDSLIRSIAYRMTNANQYEDTVHDCYIKIFKHFNGFKQNASLKTWICRICINTCKDYYKKKKNILSDQIDTFTSLGNNENLENIFTHTLEYKDRLNYLLNQLDFDELTLLNLFYYLEYSIEDISKTLQIKPGTVKSRLYYLREKCKKILLLENEKSKKNAGIKS